MTVPVGIVSEWFFSAPYEAPMVRGGDPLGLRLAAARYADALAPGLSNRTLDARWLTISVIERICARRGWEAACHWITEHRVAVEQGIVAGSMAGVLG